MTHSESDCPTADASLPGMIADAVQHTATVLRIRQLARDTWAVALHAPAIARKILPGQFFMIRPAVGSDPLLGRPFALYDTTCTENTSAEESRLPVGIEFGFVRVGKLTTIMSHWKEGEPVQVWGPLGNGFPVPQCRHLICVAGGIGQTPFLAVIQEALGRKQYGSPWRKLQVLPESITLCYGVRAAEYAAGLEDFSISGLDLRLATDDGSLGRHGLVTDLLEQRLPECGSDVHVYCCGPEPMMKAVAGICHVREIPCWLSLETPMACGFGACFSCVTKVHEQDGTWDYRRTCVEGPVFNAERLVL